MKRRTLVDEYMNEIIDYGGLYRTRADLIRDMQRMGHPQSAIDLWFWGYDTAQGFTLEKGSREDSTRALRK